METTSDRLASITLVGITPEGDERTVPLGTVPARECDLRTMDRLLRLCLAARRCGLSIRLTDVHPHLRDLAELVGVSDRLGIGADSASIPTVHRDHLGST
jgi:hypothetical protein